MENEIIHTKLQRPSVAPDILPRARLMDRLEQGCGLALTLISAPAGYGKSTLASRWLRTGGSPCAWVSLDETDNDLRTFMAYVLAAVRSAFPRMRLQTEALLEAGELPPVHVLATHLLNDLNRIKKGFMLVLDDYQRIHNIQIHDLISEVLDHPPRGVHLVLLTRRDPPLPVARMRGRGQVNEIRAADLRFTPVEAEAFLKDKLSLPVDHATAALLAEKTEGWVTGLRLAGLYLRDRSDMRLQVQGFSGSSRHIAEYLVEEVLSGQDPQIAAFLLETSILDRFCAPLCEAVHSRAAKGRVKQNDEKRGPDARRFIDWLADANIFVIALDDKGYWFRYHHLFQEFLRTLLRRQMSPGDIARLHMRAGKWFAENGLIDEALRHALAAGDTRTAVRLVVEHRHELMKTAQYHRLYGWLKLLPKQTVDKSPLLVSTMALMALESGRDADMYAYTELARRISEELPAGSPEETEFQGEIAAMQSVVSVFLGDSAMAIELAEKALESLPGNALFVRSLAIAAAAAARQMEGDLRGGVKMLRDALKAPGLTASLHARMLFYLCIVNFMDADAEGTLRAGHESLEITEASGYAHTRAVVRYFMGAVHYLRNELAVAGSYLEGVLRDRPVTNPSYVVQASGILAFICLHKGSAEEAGGRLIQPGGKDSWEADEAYARANAEALRVELALRAGDVSEARRLGMAVDFDMRPPLWLLYVPQLTHIKLLLAEGGDRNLEHARSRLAELEEQMVRVNRRSVLIDVLALEALVLSRLGQEAKALKKLKAALALAEQAGYVRNFLDLGAPVTGLLERLHEAHPADRYAGEVLEACRAEVRGSAHAGRRHEERLRPSGQTTPPLLTRRETQLLTLLADGISNREIALRLNIATETVKTHLQNIYRKLETRGRVATLKRARTLGVIARD